MITSAAELTAFLKRYHAPLLQSDPPRPLPAANVEVPPALQLLYDAFGHHVGAPGGPLDAQDHLYGPDELKEVGGRVTFLGENQGCWWCSYGAEADGNPVYCSDDDQHPEGLRVCDSLEAFLITFGLQEAVMSSPYMLSVQEDARMEDLGIPLIPLHLEGRYACDWLTHHFWCTEDESIIGMDYQILWLAAWSPALLDRRKPGIAYQVTAPEDRHGAKTYQHKSQTQLGRRSLGDRIRSWFSKRR